MENELRTLLGDLKRDLEGLKEETADISGKVQTLSERGEARDRRIADLEEKVTPMRENYRSLVECNQAMVRLIDGIRSQIDTLAVDTGAAVEKHLRPEILGMRKELGDALAQVKSRLDNRPCLVDGSCVLPSKEK